jgi:hypothetical protein
MGFCRRSHTMSCGGGWTLIGRRRLILPSARLAAAVG